VRTIGVVTVGRSDYGHSLPILRHLQQESDLAFYLLVTGAHLSPEFGLTVKTIESDGFEIGDRIEMLLSSDRPEGIAKSTGLGIIGFSQAFARRRPDILLVLGDRFEMYAAAVAALPFRIPVAHVHGGEVTQGAIDDALRHSLTKLSHLHFTATEEYARRVRQMGEEAWRITVSGAPGLDNLRAVPLLGRADWENRYGLPLGQDPPLLVTYHPVTLEYEQAEWQATEVLAALEAADRPIIFTLPNADTHGRVIRRLVLEYVQSHPSARAVDSLGMQGYFSLMALAAAMLGNSSSGLIEAPSFELPVVNVGSRQAGRVRAANVIDAGNTRGEIIAALRQALTPQFRSVLKGLRNPYGDGRAAERIVTRLKSTDVGDRLIRKRFADLEG
jgi:UDP-hydrolysing UDP-N-acetyl-D-glucosamine 2-epimerase